MWRNYAMLTLRRKKNNQEGEQSDEDMKNQNEDLQEKIIQLEENNKSLKVEFDDVRKKVEELLSTNTELEEKWKECQGVSDGVEKTIEEIKSDIRKLFCKMNTQPDCVNKQDNDGEQNSINDELSNKYDEIIVKIEGIEQKIAVDLNKDQIIRDIHNELQMYKNGLRYEITKPILNSILLIYDAVHTFDESVKEKSEFKAVKYSVEDLLFEYDIVPIKTYAGDIFDPAIHHAISKKIVQDEKLDKTIAQVVKQGFMNNSSGHIFRTPEVIVYVNQSNE